MTVESGAEVQHGAPRCLLGLFDAAATGCLADWSEFDAEAERWGIEVCGLSCQGLTALINSSTRQIPITEHRRLHQEASDFVRWGRRGDLRTLALYGMPYFSLLARFRWERVQFESLIEHRAGSSKGLGRCDSPPPVQSWCPRTQLGRRRVVEEIIGRLPKLTGSQLGRLEEEIRRERQRRALSAGGGQDAPCMQEGAAPPVTKVLEYAPTRTAICSLSCAATYVVTAHRASVDPTGTSNSTRGKA